MSESLVGQFEVERSLHGRQRGAEDAYATPSDTAALEARILVLETTVNALIATLNAATATCNEDTTITLEYPDIPDPI